jgi:hypothetical protein
MAPFDARQTELTLFPTRVLTLEFAGAEALNAELYRFFTEYGPFQDPDFLKDGDAANLLDLADACPAVGRLKGMFLDGLRRWLAAEGVAGDYTARLYMLSNFARTGEFTPAHNHAAHVAGVYYVRVPSPGPRARRAPTPADYWAQDNGALILHDPRFNANLADLSQPGYEKVFPRPGLMVLFPGYLWHSVTPHRDAERRLSIACNFWLERRDEASPHTVDLSLGGA